MRRLIALAALVFVSVPVAARQAAPKERAPESAAETARRTAWWREAKFGMFIHWGLYAVPADATDRAGNRAVGEWYFSNKRMQVKEYEKFAPQFNPVQFDARAWVRTAKQAGMKYIVITSKHHDGFCMFDSKLTDYTITRATPFKRDPLKELAAECRKQGIVLCFYHSIMDWHHPDYLPRRDWERDERPATGANLSRYIDHMKGQLTELLTNYGRVGVIWFDGGWEHNAGELRSAEVNAMIRRLQPGIIINDRNQLPEDHSTPEQTIPAGAMPNGRMWETCMTMNDTWGFARNDTNWKSTEDLIRKLCDIAHKGGNFLLNVGPTPEGTFPEAINERLAGAGEWMKVNGRAIYGTAQSPFRRLPFEGRCTVKGSSMYLMVFQWPSAGLRLEGLQTRIVSARSLGGEALRVEHPAGGSGVVYIGKPAVIDPIATVVELKLAGKPVVVNATPAIGPGADGVISLRAGDAEIHGGTAQYEAGDGRDNIGYWLDARDYVTWRVQAPAAGEYEVTAEVACVDGEAGSQFSVGIEPGASVEGSVPGTGSYTSFRTVALGRLTLAAGAQTVAVRAVRMARSVVMNLRSVRMAPAGAGR